MASRAFAAIASLLLFMITFLLLGYGLISSGAALWATALVLLVVNIVIVFITWTNIRRFYRYASRPFQIQAAI